MSSRQLSVAGYLAIGLALVLAMPVFADNEPPPEAPAAPVAAQVETANIGDKTDGGEEAAITELSATDELHTLDGERKIWFKVGSLLYDNYETLQDAIDVITLAGLPSDRTIHVQDGIYDVDSDYDAMLNGGSNPWLAQMKAIKGTGGYPDNSDAPYMVGNLVVSDTIAGFTIEGLQFEGALDIKNNTGALTIQNVDLFGNDNGILVSNHNGAITLNSVNASGGNSVDLDNTASSSAGVTIYNSVFNDHSGGPGLAITTRGMATLTGVSARDNDTNGVEIGAKGGVKVVHGMFINNGGFGLGIFPSAAGDVSNIFIDSIVARDNAFSGVGIFSATGSITIKQTSAGDNGWRGIDIHGIGSDDDRIASAITLVDVGAYNNNNEGIYIHTNGAAALTRVSGDWNHHVSGIYILTPGVITLNSITAHHNGNGSESMFGVVLNNQFAGSSKGVTITNTYYRNMVSDNEGNGLWIRTNGAVSIKGLDASNNAFVDNSDGYGILISGGTASNVALTDVRADNNDQFGVKIDTLGTIAWIGGSANQNGWDNNGERFGAQLENQYAATIKAVSLANLDFYENYNGSGLTVRSKGAITIKTSGASKNDGFGMDLSNNLSGGSGAISVLATATQGNEFRENGDTGLKIQARGAVTLAYLGAINNLGDGFYINNTYAATTALVGLVNVNADSNTGDGIHVETKGAVTATNLDSSWNGGGGVNIDASQGTGAVKVLRTAYWHNYISDNGKDGLTILARGAVTLARLMTNNNGGTGAFIDNCLALPDDSCLGSGAVTFQITPGWNHDFNNNGASGLYVQSKGAISISNINAWNNAGVGAILDNNWVGANGATTIGSVGGSKNNFNQNGDSGLVVYSTGAISLSNYESCENYGYGAHLYNAAATSPKAVMVLNGYARDNTNGDGLRVSSKGNIKVVSVSSDRNDARDMFLNPGESVAEWLAPDNAENGDAWKFTLENDATDDIIMRLYIDFNAVLTLQYLDEGVEDWLQYAGNTVSGEGVLFLNAGILSADQYRVLVQGTDSGENGDYRLSINDVWQNNLQRNGANGFDLSNSYYGGAGTIQLLPGASQTTVNANENSATGIIAFSRKAVILSQVHAELNSGRGAIVDNCLWDDDAWGCSATAPVTISGSNNGFFHNTWDGISIITNGAVSLVNLSASENGWGYDADENIGDGAYIDAGGNVSLVTTAANPYSNWLSHNGYNGLYISTMGAITVNKVEARGNGEEGAWLYNSDALNPKGVTVTNSSFNENGSGLDVWTIGAVVLKNVQTNNNHLYGTYVFNDITFAPVTIQQSDFSGNQYGDGIEVEVWGNILWNSASANGNAWNGAILDNYNGIGNVILLGSYGLNDFYGNGTTGLDITTNSLTVNNTRAGFSVMGMAAYTYGPVTINNSTFENSSQNGLYVFTDYGNLNLQNVSVFRNALGTDDDFAGAVLTATYGNITIANSAFSGNGDAGLSVYWEDPFKIMLPNSPYYGNDLDNDGSPNWNLEDHSP